VFVESGGAPIPLSEVGRGGGGEGGEAQAPQIRFDPLGRIEGFRIRLERGARGYAIAAEPGGQVRVTPLGRG